MVPPTIAAIATPTGSGGIGIIRISGTSAFDIGTSIFRLKSSTGKSTRLHADDIQSHFFYYGYIFDAVNHRNIDEVLIVFMRSPRSYTREDIVEIHAHAGLFTLSAILELVFTHRAIPAQPGEFTKRAFLNGRIDLTQTEAVIDILNAQSTLALQVATQQIAGGIRDKVFQIREQLLNLHAQLEAAVDFPEDIDDIMSFETVLHDLAFSVKTPIFNMLNQYREKSFIREGLTIVITGAPNVGKSSLMNQLLQTERAIVTPIPGTTRDLIKEHLVLNNIHTQLMDTAGIHNTDDPVEIIGVKKSEEQIDAADIVLFLIQAGSEISKEDEYIFHCVKNKRTILIINKSDLMAVNDIPHLPDHWRHLPSVSISALYGHGIDSLKNIIAEKFLNGFNDQPDFILPNLRHKKSLEKCLESIANFERGIQNDIPCDLLSLDIQDSINALNEITGENVPPDVLDRIFETFCIGK